MIFADQIAAWEKVTNTFLARLEPSPDLEKIKAAFQQLVSDVRAYAAQKAGS